MGMTPDQHLFCTLLAAAVERAHRAAEAVQAAEPTLVAEVQIVDSLPWRELRNPRSLPALTARLQVGEGTIGVQLVPEETESSMRRRIERAVRRLYSAGAAHDPA